jgi:hypothetical protein
MLLALTNLLPQITHFCIITNHKLSTKTVLHAIPKAANKNNFAINNHKLSTNTHKKVLLAIPKATNKNDLI